MSTILAIETSCDDTSIAIIKNGTDILCNLVSSQIKTHSKHGGVVPEIASRMHTEVINSLLIKALDQANHTLEDITHIAVTKEPGLEGSLLVGNAIARTLATLLKRPLIEVNHLYGHIYSNFIDTPSPQFPFICLIVSGGHTQLMLAKDHFQFELLGETRDDAAGEAFDKVARVLELGYPGGPVIQKTAETGDPNAFKFPRPMAHSPYEFSFSGLKTAVIQTIQTLKQSDKPLPTEDLCASFQAAVIDTLVSKTINAAKDHNCPDIAVCGGVSANGPLRTTFQAEADKHQINLHIPAFKYCTDNAAMIAKAAAQTL